MSKIAASPGVHIEEVPSGSHPIMGVSTSVPAFLGFTLSDEIATPRRVVGWNQFCDTFWPPDVQKFVSVLRRVLEVPVNAGDTTRKQKAKLASARDEVGKMADRLGLVLPSFNDSGDASADEEATLRGLRDLLGLLEDTPLAVRGFFENGGAVCYVSSLKISQDKKTQALTVDLDSALKDLLEVPEISSIAAPCLWSVSRVLRWGEDQDTVLETFKEFQLEILRRCADPDTEKQLMVVLDGWPGTGPGDLDEEDSDFIDLPDHYLQYAAYYYPWLIVPTGDSGSTRVPPCGHVAGMWARVDEERGVHKAPANEVLLGVNGLEYEITDALQAPLNSRGVNCIRRFPGYGPLVWGARTLDTTDTEWRYVNVRRLISFLEDSIVRGMQWVVFESNDERLWSSIRRNVTVFLTDQWRAGALKGATVNQAFSVCCDETNNPQERVDEGILVCDVAVAPVYPSEFVTFRISQLVGQAGA